MREVDRLMTEEFGIELIQMMENAGRCLADHCRAELGGDVRARRVVVLAGGGGNGGGGMAAARRLSIWGADVSVRLALPPDRIKGVPGHQLQILERLDVPIESPDADPPTQFPAFDLVVDALIGYSLKGAPSGTAKQLIESANDSRTPIVALDIPSGVDGDSGTAAGVAVRAATTLTLALPKTGLLRAEAAPYVGRVYLADISVPAVVYDRLGVSVGPLFATSDIVSITS
jgi:NAD(P)H-hydrate epimerase